jgi:glycosyltransferase involved in cell wall biosynthesis
MRLALMAHVFGFNDGQGRVNFEVAHAALKAGHSVTLVGQSCDATLTAYESFRFVQFKRSKLPTQSLKNISFAVRSARWLRKHRAEFDVIQANGFITWGDVDVVAAHFVHSAWLQQPGYPFKSWTKPYEIYQRAHTVFNAWQERAVYRGAARVIPVSRKTGGEVEALGVDPARIKVAYNGVDIDTFHPGAQDRAFFNLPSNVKLAAFVGDLRTPRKNVGLVLHAMTLLPELHLVVAGDLTASPYPALAKELGIAERVHFIGKTVEVARLIRSVDVFILPSRYEAHPLVVMEAMASGVPVIVSANVAAIEDFRDAVLILNDLDAPDELATMIAKLLADPARMKSYGAKAREFTEGMTWGHTAAKYLEVYGEVVSEKRSVAAAT